MCLSLSTNEVGETHVLKTERGPQVSAKLLPPLLLSVVFLDALIASAVVTTAEFAY